MLKRNIYTRVRRRREEKESETFGRRGPFGKFAQGNNIEDLSARKKEAHRSAIET